MRETRNFSDPIQGGGSRTDKPLLGLSTKDTKYRLAWGIFQERVRANKSFSETLKVSILAGMGDVLSEVEDDLTNE
jgi:hypothetical protein